jgi:phosphatidylglycerophosphate synthase
MEQSGTDFSAMASGKAKMVVQAGAIPLILVLLGITPVGPGTWGRLCIDATVYVTLVVTVISGVPYVTAAFRASRPASVR